jgi:hypothetical protein
MFYVKEMIGHYDVFPLNNDMHGDHEEGSAVIVGCPAFMGFMVLPFQVHPFASRRWVGLHTPAPPLV